VSRNRLLSIALAAALSAGALAPLTARAHADVSVAEPRAGLTAADLEAPAELPETKPAAPAAAPEPADEKPKGNAFVRVITAPFRALGRLFGGGRKSSDAAKKRQEQPHVNADAAKAVESPARKPETTATAAQAPALVAPPPEPVVKIVRPDEQPRAARPDRMWIPVIEGIGKDPLTQGRALLQHGYLNEAIAELSAAAAGTQDLAEANNLLGLAYDRLGDHRAAVEAYERALTASPKDPVLLANLGYSLYLSNDFGGALKRLRESVKLRPEFGVVHNNLGIVHARLGKYDEAFRSFARATNEYDAHLKLAGILEFERRDKQAIKHYEAALRLQPGTTLVIERLVGLYERTGDRTKADTARRTLGQPKNEQRTTTGGG
jgi:tetratricopeptide (TPR) repeat protein